MRRKSHPSMQKTYDDCNLIRSAAIHFEDQHNETEALRLWRHALDQINYLKAHQMPISAQSKLEGETLQGSVRQLELQCKEHIDLLETLQRSRLDDGNSNVPESRRHGPSAYINHAQMISARKEGKAGASGLSREGMSQPAEPYNLSGPPLPLRPSARPSPATTSAQMSRPSQPSPNVESRFLSTGSPSRTSSQSQGDDSRASSPEKRTRLRRTLRPAREGNRTNTPPAPRNLLSSRPPVAARAASQAWALPSSLSDSATNRSSRDATIGRHARKQSAEGRSRSPNVQSEGSSPLQSRTGWPDEVNKPLVRDRSDYRQPPNAIHRKPVVPRDQLTPNQPSRPRNKQAELPQSTNTRVDSPHARSMTHEMSHLWRAGTQSSTHDTEDHQRTRSNNHLRGQKSEGNMGVEPGASRKAEDNKIEQDWTSQVDKILRNLPKGLDENAAKQILNEIVIKGDQVHWDDVAGLDIAKAALKETVVYPFLRPDLFRGLREPARGLLLFGPPGTGKTMLARAVATESKSTFFAISASSLTSKYLGESEKLVRALFLLARVLAPSIIFVDEIDSLLSPRSGSGEHEATRRIKTEFLIQWSDLARAAAGKEQSDEALKHGDASRVLVLAATNMPWAIDEAARRRFVRRQYIPLPEDHVRAVQLRTLLSHQNHRITDADMDRLVELTQGFSGSDITALAKDAAMGPLRSLGEKLLYMTTDEIRPILFKDFEASLVTIRPSVSKDGLKQYEDWAKEFGERGG